MQSKSYRLDRHTESWKFARKFKASAVSLTNPRNFTFIPYAKELKREGIDKVKIKNNNALQLFTFLFILYCKTCHLCHIQVL